MSKKQQKQREAAIKQQQKMQRLTEMHAKNIVSGSSDKDPQLLKYIAENDDLPDLKDDTLEYMMNKTVSTANLTSDEVKGIEWENEIAILRYLQSHPPSYGITGYLRAYIFQDMNEYRNPVDRMEKIKQQGLGMLSKLAVTRSEEFIGVDTASRDTTETIVSNDEEETSGGMLQRYR